MLCLQSRLQLYEAAKTVVSSGLLMLGITPLDRMWTVVIHARAWSTRCHTSADLPAVKYSCGQVTPKLWTVDG